MELIFRPKTHRTAFREIASYAQYKLESHVEFQDEQGKENVQHKEQPQ